MQDREVSPERKVFQPGTKLAWILFFPNFKWIIPWTSGLNGGLPWSCEIEVSHMGKNISYRQRCEK